MKEYHKGGEITRLYTQAWIRLILLLKLVQMNPRERTFNGGDKLWISLIIGVVTTYLNQERIVFSCVIDRFSGTQ